MQSGLLQSYWDTQLKNMPRREVQANLKQAGFNFPTGSLSDQDLRKVYLGLLSRLDDEQIRSLIGERVR